MGQNLSNIRIRGTVYHYRRRVPPKLVPIMGQTEVIRSLETSSAREARRRASVMCVETDRAFKQMSQVSLAEEQVATIVRRLKNEQFWDSPTREEILSSYVDGDHWTLDRLFALGGPQIASLSSEEGPQVAMHLRRLLEGVEQHLMQKRTKLAEVRAENAEIASVLAVLDAEGALIRAEERLAAPAEAVVSTRKASPLFSSLTEEFILHKRTADDDGNAYSAQTEAQVRATFRLWVELVGDLAVRDYSRAQVGTFRSSLLQLPASHGKSSSRQISASVAIAENRVLPVPKRTLTMKTAKRHFSALMQYWKWLKTRGYVDEVIFSGFEFPGTKSNRRRRDDWSPADLRRLFSYEPWYGDTASRQSSFFWLPLVALYSGMRLEEICRLRPDQDIKEVEGVPAFVIQPHPDGWNPKSEAGERIVPIHSRLVEHGFLRFVASRSGSARLFTDLVPGGPDRKLSYTYSREFSRAKKAKIGVGDKTTFHSFRHSVRTILTDVDGQLRDAWIDAVMGHSADEGRSQSEGVRTYLKRIGVARLRQVVEAISPPVELAHLLKGKSLA